MLWPFDLKSTECIDVLRRFATDPLLLRAVQEANTAVDEIVAQHGTDQLHNNTHTSLMWCWLHNSLADYRWDDGRSGWTHCYQTIAAGICQLLRPGFPGIDSSRSDPFACRFLMRPVQFNQFIARYLPCLNISLPSRLLLCQMPYTAVAARGPWVVSLHGAGTWPPPPPHTHTCVFIFHVAIIISYKYSQIHSSFLHPHFYWDSHSRQRWLWDACLRALPRFSHAGSGSPYVHGNDILILLLFFSLLPFPFLPVSIWGLNFFIFDVLWPPPPPHRPHHHKHAHTRALALSHTHAFTISLFNSDCGIYYILFLMVFKYVFSLDRFCI